MLVSAAESSLLMQPKHFLVEAMSKVIASIHKVNYISISKVDEFVYVYRVTYFVGFKKYSRFISRKQVILATRLYQLWLSKKINKKASKQFPVKTCIGNVPTKLPIYGIVAYQGKFFWIYAYKRIAVIVIGNKMYTSAIKFETVFANHLIKYEYFN